VIAAAESQAPRVAGFRIRLLLAMMLVVSAVTLLVLFLAQRRLAETFENELRVAFEAEIEALERTQAMRHGALLERCRALVRRPRIQQSLEEAPDLLYPNANDELRDLTTVPAGSDAPAARGLHAQFYRFLDRHGAVIFPPQPRAEGTLARETEARLALPRLPDRPQLGYVAYRDVDGATMVSEIIAMPIVSGETQAPVGALVLGFKPFELTGRPGGMRNAVWLDGQFHSRVLPPSAHASLAGEVRRASGDPQPVEIDGEPHLLLAKRLNPDSLYPEAFDVWAFPLAQLQARQARLRGQILGAGALLLLVALALSHLLAARLSAPVEQLAVDSEEDRAQRRRAEAALESTSAELQRSARFSADASHQLKTPVTVLRAGLEELLARENLTPAECEQVSALIHQTYRLSSLIEDLLLLSRMDAGRLKLNLAVVDLRAIIEAGLDDLGALPDELGVGVETDLPPALRVIGEKRYTAIVLQNLLENARKYNLPGGRIRIVAKIEGEWVRVLIANTGQAIARQTQEHIFERFHRGGVGENVPGYGLGLNLARELARLHQGDLQLVRSDEQWTEFEIRLRVARERVAAEASA
jgi:signal transduction histidine kinase